jgi:hypothetical protein
VQHHAGGIDDAYQGWPSSLCQLLPHRCQPATDRLTRAGVSGPPQSGSDAVYNDLPGCLTEQTVPFRFG